MLIFLQDKLKNHLKYKNDCFKIIQEIVSLAEIAHKRGSVKGLGAHVTNKDCFLLTDGIQMVEEGIDTPTIYNIAENYIRFSGLSEKESVLAFFTLQGIVLIRDGYNPRLIEKIMVSNFGLENAETYYSAKECGGQGGSI